MTTSTYNLLFICTGNSARSPLAEAIHRAFSDAFMALSRRNALLTALLTAGPIDKLALKHELADIGQVKA